MRFGAVRGEERAIWREAVAIRCATSVVVFDSGDAELLRRLNERKPVDMAEELANEAACRRPGDWRRVVIAAARRQLGRARDTTGADADRTQIERVAARLDELER